MFVHACEVAAADVSVIGGKLDPTAPGRGAHLTFDKILGLCGQAWMAFLSELGSFGVEIICPRVEIDYHREVGAGEVLIEVAVLSVGTSSFRLALSVHQAGQRAAHAEVVLVAFDYASGRSIALSDDQRAVLLRSNSPELPVSSSNAAMSINRTG